MQIASHSEPLVYSVNGACSALSIGRTSLYALIKEGKLPVRKAGRRTLIPAASVRALVEGASV
jgi:excisionase family DNA binding protein